MNWLCGTTVPEPEPLVIPLNGKSVVFFYGGENTGWYGLKKIGFANDTVATSFIPEAIKKVHNLNELHYNRTVLAQKLVRETNNVRSDYTLKTRMTIPADGGRMVAIEFDHFSQVLEYVEEVEAMLQKRDMVLNFKNPDTVQYLEKLKKMMTEGKNQYSPVITRAAQYRSVCEQPGPSSTTKRYNA